MYKGIAVEGQSVIDIGAGQLLVKPKIIAFKAIILVFIVILIISPNCRVGTE